MNWDTLAKKLRDIGYELTEEKRAQLARYAELLQDWNQRINLTTITTLEAIIEKHFWDSLASAEVFTYDDQSLLDVGSGAGFPGIPLKIMFPDLAVTLLEPTEKRVRFLQAVIQELGLKGIVTVQARAEDYITQARSYYQVVTARAVARLPILLELTAPFLSPGGVLIALKGSQAEQELREAQHAIDVLGLEILPTQTLILSQGEHRSNLFFRYGKEIPLKYPRSYGQIVKKPL